MNYGKPQKTIFSFFEIICNDMKKSPATYVTRLFDILKKLVYLFFYKF